MLNIPSPRIARSERLSNVIKAFQNPVWVEQARERLKQIKVLTGDNLWFGKI
jgi:hypothetical protein